MDMETEYEEEPADGSHERASESRHPYEGEHGDTSRRSSKGEIVSKSGHSSEDEERASEKRHLFEGEHADISSRSSEGEHWDESGHSSEGEARASVKRHLYEGEHADISRRSSEGEIVSESGHLSEDEERASEKRHLYEGEQTDMSRRSSEGNHAGADAFAGKIAASPDTTDGVGDGRVVFDRVTFGYQADAPTLREIDFVAEPGQVVALVGPTGAGKTTIINLLTRFYDVDEGAITIDGHDIRGIAKDELRSRLGIVLQDAYLFSDTIRENIRYGRLDATDAQIAEAARLANADAFIRKLPLGYDTPMTSSGGNLSHGQRQLITIARAILANPDILVLDEATSSVDTRTEMHIQEAMNALMQGRTSFVIAHRLNTVRGADLILVIDGGEIIERGTHEQLLAREGFYARLYNSQFQRAV
ncbi:ATP-binding cassette domain-containing protein [Cohnella nanjingensis]|uniref:ATP-binding cassette domain-containing protein n=2 Tax=Cohnella nanjingensis TaxID=1387779 RepID=A0A7X0RLS5_9BACL|nr:ATP-binding cassette domain-containing protein [Cohnella nanjingensis]